VIKHYINTVPLLTLKTSSIIHQTKYTKFFKQIWYVGRVRRVMHDGMQIQGQGHDSRVLESWKFGHFQTLSPPPFIMGAGK